MGALPKRKISTHRRGRRRKFHSARLETLVKCGKCGETKRPHSLCPSCKKY